MNGYDKPLTIEQIAAMKDEDIDFSDIPELDEEFWREADVKLPDRTEQITLRVKGSVLAYFKASGKGYQTRLNHVLESYVRRKESQQRRQSLQESPEQSPAIQESDHSWNREKTLPIGPVMHIRITLGPIVGENDFLTAGIRVVPDGRNGKQSVRSYLEP